jgi:o-succinylbenzoate synthase
MSIYIHQFHLPFYQPLVTAKGTFQTREGLLLEVTVDGNRFWGEVSPLPGFSTTTLSECIYWLSQHKDLFFSNLISKGEITVDNLNIPGLLEALSGDIDLALVENMPPEIEFAFDTLLFQALINRHKITPHANPPVLHVNAAASNLNSALKSIENGFKTIKLKVGIDWTTEFEMITKIREIYPDVALRLDANESWSLEQARSILGQLRDLRIEYIEQPVNQSDLLLFGRELRKFGVQIAADESARSINSIRQLIDANSADVFIIKPPMLGGFHKTHQAIEEIKASGNRTILTSSLDSELNLSMASLLAYYWANASDSHGFSTGSLLSRDLNPNRSKNSQSQFTLDLNWILNPDNTLDRSQLTQIL